MAGQPRCAETCVLTPLVVLLQVFIYAAFSDAIVGITQLLNAWPKKGFLRCSCPITFSFISLYISLGYLS